MTFEGPSYRTICQADGRWSHPLPRCYGKKGNQEKRKKIIAIEYSRLECHVSPKKARSNVVGAAKLIELT